MGIEQQIGALVMASENLTGAVNKKVGEIDKKVDEATGAVPQTVFELFDQKVYVNEGAGSDLYEGTAQRPYKTLAKAIAAMPSGGKTQIIMQSDLSNFFGWDNWTGIERRQQ